MTRRLGSHGPLHELTQWTSARLEQGRVGASATTGATLEFGMDHARARDAIQTRLDLPVLEAQLRAAGFDVLHVASEASDRAEYLRRPDLGRRLPTALSQQLSADPVPHKLTIVVADGLSALAPMLHAANLLEALRARLSGWELDEIVLAEQARVALGDAIGEARQAEAVLVLIGERPGLKSFDSLGAYLTYAPRVGRTDAERNCVSNIRGGGLAYAEAAALLASPLAGARALGCSGIALKHEEQVLLEAEQAVPHASRTLQ